MPEKADALGIFLILLPGFSCAYVAQYLSVRRKQSDLDKVIEALLFSVVLYVATLPFFGNRLPASWHTIAGVPGIYEVAIQWSQFCALAVSSVVLGIIYAANINHDWLMSLFRYLHVTERTARSTIWNDVFQEIGGPVQVGLAGDVRVVGWLRYYSDEAEESSIFVEQAAWIDKDGNENPIPGPGILLTKDVGIEYVLFLDEPDEHAQAENEITSGKDGRFESSVPSGAIRSPSAPVPNRAE